MVVHDMLKLDGDTTVPQMEDCGENIAKMILRQSMQTKICGPGMMQRQKLKSSMKLIFLLGCYLKTILLNQFSP